MEKESFGQALVEAALEMGAKDAKVFGIDDIVFDPRTLLKCLFGCGSKLPFCPTKQDTATSVLYPDLLRRYKWGVIVCTNTVKKGQEITLELERKAFLAGHYFALGSTECANCSPCSCEEGKPCVAPKKVRPQMCALGIDVFATVRGLGWTLDVVMKKGDPIKNFTAVFVE